MGDKLRRKQYIVTINGLQLDDNINYILESVVYRNMPSRDIVEAPTSTRPGNKFITTEWVTKDIELKGRIMGTTVSGLLGNVDILQQNASVQSLALTVDTGRVYTVNLSRLEIQNEFYNNTMVAYSAVFHASDPFSYGNTLTASGTVASGITTFSGTLTVSGTVFAEPTLTIYPRGALAGTSGLQALQTMYTSTGESVTVSGIISYLSPLSLNYKNFTVTNSGTNSDYSGIFSRWEPGADAYTITVTSGTNSGYNYVWSYAPRYFT